jgi:type VI secretion system protein ImpL
MGGYLAHLSRLRTRFNAIKNQGDPGPGARLLMQQTLDGKDSELNDALKYVDEQMLTGISDAQKAALRPILVRPLMQSFSVIIGPTEAELDKVWRAQVLLPYQKGLATKFPFNGAATAEAGQEEIGVMFGPSGAIAQFFTSAVGPLATRRGDDIEAKKWAGMGVTLAPQVLTSVPGWIAPLSAGGVASAASTAPGEPQTTFELQATGATGAGEFTVEIDGQAVRWKGIAQPWVQMAWPSFQGEPGCRISAITPDGRTLVILSEPGRFGFNRMLAAASRERLAAGGYKLTWTAAAVAVSVNLKVLSHATTPAPRPAHGASTGFRNLRLPESIIGARP